MTRWGLDSTHIPDPQQAWDLGWRVLCRYLSPGPNPKNLTRDEIAQDHDIGFDIWPNFELDVNDATRGADFGKQAMTVATNELLAAGAPADGKNTDGTPICVPFSCDTFATADQVRSYYQGAASVGSPFLVGAYGGSIPMVPLLQEGTIHRWWMANAGFWSGFNTSNFPTDLRADARQFVGLPAGAPPWPVGSFDANLFMHDEVGLWKSPKSISAPAAPPYPVVSHEGGPMAISVYPKDPTRTDGVDLGADGKLYHWARSNLGPDIITPTDWEVIGPSVPLARVSWVQWKPDSSGMWCSVVDTNGMAWISLMDGHSGAFSPFTTLFSVPLKV